MKLECLNDIISDRLAIHIDASDINSWDLNSGFTSISLTKWSGAKSDNINLYDFGLTEYDNGRVNSMLSGLTLTPSDVLTTLYRVGYNNATGGTFYDLYPMSGVTTGSTVGNYFELDGGYLQGFFKLQGENYEVLPARYGEGITIENILRIDQDSSGIFYLMGARAEDKYNPFFSGETELIVKNVVEQVRTGVVGESATVVEERTTFSGVTTSKDTYLNAYLDEEQLQDSFGDFQFQYETVPVEQPKDSTFDNVVAFELTQDKRIAIKRITSDGLIDTKVSPNTITVTPSGWTIITQVFTPDLIITDPEELKCADRRTGDLTFYVNGRKFWELNDFDEYYFVDFKNDPEKVIGVPYNISWDGGSFGLKHSWHWDLETYNLYTGNTQQYIDDNFIVIDNPIEDDICGDIPPIITGGTGNSIVLLENNNTFMIEDICDPTTGETITVMEATYSGATGNSLNEYFIEFGEPLELISNRDYNFSVDIYDAGIFPLSGKSSISLLVYGSTDVSIISDVVYKRPITIGDLNTNAPYKIIPDQFEYLDEESGLLIYGETGLPVINSNNLAILQANAQNSIVAGLNEWHTIKTKIETEANSGSGIFYVGILIESNEPINETGKLYINNFKYNGSDILNQDKNKNNELIEQNFNSSYKGGIQKLRVYDIAFDSSQVLHNARIESIGNPNYGLIIRRGGRIIYT